MLRVKNEENTSINQYEGKKNISYSDVNEPINPSKKGTAKILYCNGLALIIKLGS